MLGMGDSDKLENSGHMSYTFELHYKYLSEFIRSLELTQPVTLVGQIGEDLLLLNGQEKIMFEVFAISKL